MRDDPSEKTGRKPRADAERNRLRLLDAAKIAFADKGAAASLDEIARMAGVGIGTLYRHFPTRDALIGAVYHKESTQLALAAERLMATETPVEALRLWLLVFVDYLAAKHGMAEVLNSVDGGPSALFANSGAHVKQAVAMLTERASAAGQIRLTLEPLDLLRAIAGVANISAGAGWQQSARQLVEVLVAGMRTGTASA